MRNNKKKLISFLTIFTLLFVSISFALSKVVSYADELNSIKTYTISSSSRSSSKSSRPKSYKSNSSKNFLALEALTLEVVAIKKITQQQ